MCKTQRLRPSSRKGWKLAIKCESRRHMIQEKHTLKEQGIKAIPVKRGGLSSPYPYELYTKQK